MTDLAFVVATHAIVLGGIAGYAWSLRSRRQTAETLDAEIWRASRGVKPPAAPIDRADAPIRPVALGERR